MKLNFLRSPGKPAMYVGLAMAGLLFVNCSKDDDTPPVYDFDNEFENLAEMPALNIEEPTFDEPDLGGVQQSAATENLISELTAGGAISVETQAKLDAMDSFTADLSAGVKAEASSLTSARIEELLNMASFDGDLAALVAKLDNLPDDVRALLPVILFSDDFTTTSVIANKNGLDISGKDLYSQSNQSRCFEAANSAYNKAMEKPIATHAEQEQQIADFRVNQEALAETREQTRKNNVTEGAATYREAIKANAVALLALADTYKDSNPALAETLRMYALVYTIQGSLSVNKWKAAATQVIEDRLAAELAKILEIRNRLENETNANFTAIQNAAQGILNAALENCHNQGSGS